MMSSKEKIYAQFKHGKFCHVTKLKVGLEAGRVFRLTKK